MGHGTTNYLRECGHFANRVTEKNGVIQRWMQLDIWSARNLKFFEGTQTTKIGIWLKKQRDFVENKQRWKLTEIQKKRCLKHVFKNQWELWTQIASQKEDQARTEIWSVIEHLGIPDVDVQCRFQHHLVEWCFYWSQKISSVCSGNSSKVRWYGTLTLW